MTITHWYLILLGGSYGKYTYAKIAEKLEKISRNNKAWSTRILNIGQNNFIVQAAKNSTTYEIR